MAYYKPQSPLKKGDDYFYPLTHVTQVITEDGGRLNNELGLKMDLLWTNASPSSSFAPQTLSLDLSKYKTIAFFMRRHGGDTAFNIPLLFCKKVRTRLNYSHEVNYIRDVIISDSSIQFLEGGYFMTYNGNKTTDNLCMIPIEIYGIK